ncbi:MAG TPA: hypothetical protein VN736_07880 [Candidatus Limnocylindrales bacterium]|nr:hypothetical protein [Candidatus Limnocylindrales bacterium]
MDRAFRDGYLDLEFPVEPLGSAPRTLWRATVLYLRNLPFLAVLTLLIVLPVKLAIDFVAEGVTGPAASILSGVTDLFVQALLAPAAIFGIVVAMASGKHPRFGEALRWGRRQYWKMLWNSFKAEVTIALYALLLIVPGIIKYVALLFVEPVVALEGDLTANALRRSEELTAGRRWRIFGVLAPLAIFNLALSALALYGLQRASTQWYQTAVAETALSLIDLWITVASLVMYLGIVKEKQWKSR